LDAVRDIKRSGFAMRLTLPEHKTLVHEMTMPLRWGDMDTMGHINNTLYFRYFEIIRLDWYFRISGTRRLEGEGIVIINAFCNFLQQLEFPGEVRVRLFAAKPGRSSFETYFTMERTDQPGVTCAEGGAVTVWTDYRTKKSCPMPAWLRENLSR
jgi:acyl-CoA thioester hydrolase